MSTRVRVFLLSIPLVFLFAAGVLMRSTKATDTKASGPGCVGDNLSGALVNERIAVFEGVNLTIPEIALSQVPSQNVLSAANPTERFIEVDLSDQLLRAWDGNEIFLETPVSTGLPHTPTPTGEFRVWVKLRASKMEGGAGRYYYYLPNVPFIMYFENDEIPGWRGFGIHGAYWHNDFGTPRSRGCVNVHPSVAEKLYYWATPELPEGKASVFASVDNPGIKVIIHD